MQDIRYCVKCGRAYDVGTNFDTCFDCRYKKLNDKKDKKGVNKDGKI